MEYFFIILIICLGSLSGWLNWQYNKRKDFRSLIEPELRKFELKYVKSEYSGIFKVGPFKKFEIEIGKPVINDGTAQYEKQFYRKVTALTKNNLEVEIWAKIDTGWFKEDAVEFCPALNDINENESS